MKKKLWAVLLCGCLAITACGGKTEDVNKGSESEEEGNSQSGQLLNGGQTSNGDSSSGDTTEVTLGNINAADSTASGGQYWNPKGSVTLGEYLGIEVEKIDVSVSDDEVQSEIDYFLYNNSELKEVTDRTDVQEGDYINMDYELIVDGESVDQSEDYDLELGNDYFEFEEKLIGAHAGDELSLEMTIADDYYEDYLGMTGTYKVKINSIQEMIEPELNDETIAELTSCATVEEYRQSVYDGLLAQAQENAENQQRIAVIDKIIENSTFLDLDPADAQAYVDETISYYSYYASMYGMEMDDFLQLFFNSTYEEFEKLVKEEADAVVKQYLILDAVAEAEKIEVTDQEYQDALTAYTSEYGYDTSEEAEEGLGKDAVMQAVLRDKVYELLMNSAIIK